jgi:hypothetical protein
MSWTVTTWNHGSKQTFVNLNDVQLMEKIVTSIGNCQSIKMKKDNPGVKS